MDLHPSSRAVNDILAAAGLPGRIRILAEPAPTAPAAARQIGCPVGAIANSLVFATADDQPVLIMTSGRHRVDLSGVRDRYGLDLHRASADFVRAQTGQPIGGVAPVGHPRPIPTLVDRALADYEELWAAGGVPQAVFPVTYPDLVLLTNGSEADVA
jgi:prolyl-tRNA editing enzyme YbaK/EbsC (Cys-tRNA(Pro) deacylase)